MTGCDVVRPLAAELALGTLSGPERAAALAHLDTCAECRREVEELTVAADALLLAAVEVDAPVGFEVRLLDRRHADEQPPATVSNIRRLPLRRRVVGLAAAVAILAGSGGAAVGAAVAASGPSRSQQVASGIRTAALVMPAGSSRKAGEVAIMGGRPGWVMMQVADLDSASGWVNCVVHAGGRSLTVGSFQLSDGYGSWVSPLRVGVGGDSIRSAQLVSASGQVLATATF